MDANTFEEIETFTKNIVTKESVKNLTKILTDLTIGTSTIVFSPQILPAAAIVAASTQAIPVLLDIVSHVGEKYLEHVALSPFAEKTWKVIKSKFKGKTDKEIADAVDKLGPKEQGELTLEISKVIEKSMEEIDNGVLILSLANAVVSNENFIEEVRKNPELGKEIDCLKNEIKEQLTVVEIKVDSVKDDTREILRILRQPLPSKMEERLDDKKYIQRIIKDKGYSYIEEIINESKVSDVEGFLFESTTYCYSELYVEAEEKLREAIKICSKYVISRSNFGIVLERSKKYKEAMGELEKATKINITCAAAHSNLGTLLHDLRRYKEAESEIREAIRIDPYYVFAHNNLGSLLYDLRRYKEAESEFRKAIEIYQESATICNSLVEGPLRDLKRYEGAERGFIQTKELNPDYATTHRNLGFLLNKMKKYEKAEEEFRKAIKINPEDAAAHDSLGILLDKELIRYEEAEDEYRKAIKINPEDADPHNNLGILLVKLKRYEEAENEYRKVIDINPKDTNALCNLGDLLVKLERYKESEESIRKVIEIDPEDSLAYDFLAELYFIQNNNEKSLESAENALKISKTSFDKIISNFFILINLISLGRSYETYQFMKFLKNNKGYEQPYDFRNIRKAIKNTESEDRILGLINQIEKFKN